MTRHIFRLTYFKNIETFLRDGLVFAKNHPSAQRCWRTSYPDIVHRRGRSFFTPDQDNINDYVPFYFSPITSMFYTIHKGNVDLKGPDDICYGKASQDGIVFLVCNTDRIASQGLPLWFTDIACNSAFIPNFENDLSKLSTHVDWPLFEESFSKARISEIGYRGVHWDFTSKDNPMEYRNRDKKRMAEFMIKDALPMDLVDCIVVHNNGIKQQVETWMQASSFSIPVYVKSGCYF
ncbi:hypothetical protein GCM10011332_26250 [Terasakiella brassicae]|uniref:DarT domain-containing protein n=1 Tax=Terasakiella brassicae TaxID=1634917 RepID=A0A917C3X2_9PROT|nr:DUF4433 domain-containing protein [Terasakiella brassicae]GGF71024.1 hypothetical protein GCM10011332_26250 [Terasakiella brassicae]